jgi:uncharacterized membrane protein
MSKDSTTYAFLATFLSVIGFIIALFVWKNDKYVMYYAKLGLAVFILSLGAYICGLILAFVPFLGYIIYIALEILVVIVWIASWIYALSGKEQEIPVVSDIAKKINL